MNISDNALYIYDDFYEELIYILLFKDHQEVEEAVDWWSKWYEGSELVEGMSYADKRDILVSRFGCIWIDAQQYNNHERLYF